MPDKVHQQSNKNNQREITMKNLIIDCDAMPIGIPSPLYLKCFDQQGLITWDKELFAKSLYTPKTSNGLDLLEEIKSEGVRPLNGNAALWLKNHTEEIPEEWKGFRILFLGIVLRWCIPMTKDTENLVTLELWFEEARGWRCSGDFNFTENAISARHRVVILPP